MDFRGRSSQSSQPSGAQPVSQNMAAAPSTQSAQQNVTSQFKSLKSGPANVFQIGTIVLLFSVTALVIALTFLLVFSSNSQQRSVLKDKYQAVFLNNGQVYFGHINSLGSQTYDLRSIYYLQTSGASSDAAQSTSTTAATNVSLVKLGCELHAPYDQMLINNNQVIFWENLQDNSQVVKAIAAYKKQNTTQTCSAQSQSSTQQAPSTTPTTTTTPPTATTPTTVTPPTRKP